VRRLQEAAILTLDDRPLSAPKESVNPGINKLEPPD
jgi:hypothetical protein